MFKKVSLVMATVCTSLFFYSCFDSPTSPSNNKPVNSSEVDSLFSLLIDRVQKTSDVNSFDTFAAIDYESLEKSFDKIVQSDPNNQKGNLGLIVSSIVSLNASGSLKKMVDSLDTYNNSTTTYNDLGKRSASTSSLFSKMTSSYGIGGLGIAMLAKAPSLMLAPNQDPTFPKFFTISFIQNMATSEIIPALDKAIASCSRLEANQKMSIVLTFEANDYEEDTVELDLGEIYILDSQLRMARAALLMFSAYDYDIHTSSTDVSMSWIDEMRRIDNQSSYTQAFSYSADTLIRAETYNNDYKEQDYLTRLIKYNLSRPGFLKLKNAVHQKAHEDLKKVPDLIKKSLNFIENEEGSQVHDLIKQSAVTGLNSGMVDIKESMEREGISSDLSRHFRSPSALADFITTLLSGPYAFNESFKSDGKTYTVALTVDFSKWFTNPVSDLKTLLPFYKWNPESQWRVNDTTSFDSYFSGNYLYVNSEDDVSKLEPIITSRDNSSGSIKLIFSKNFVREKILSIETRIDPLYPTDNNGAKIDVEELIDQRNYFPYFADYTFNGVFPGMTRQKWLNLIWQ